MHFGFRSKGERSVCLSVCLSVGLSVCRSVGRQFSASNKQFHEAAVVFRDHLERFLPPDHRKRLVGLLRHLPSRIAIGHSFTHPG